MSDLELIHYSAEPLAAVHSTEQGGPMEYLKPAGLWFSAMRILMLI